MQDEVIDPPAEEPTATPAEAAVETPIVDVAVGDVIDGRTVHAVKRVRGEGVFLQFEGSDDWIAQGA